MAIATDETPDEVLVVAAILGDFDAFNELVRRYRPAVVRTARTIAGAEDAEDVAQDALLLAFKALPSIDHPDRFAAWLMMITRHRALRVNRQARARQARQVHLDDVLLEQLGAVAEPQARQREVSDMLNRALDDIPNDYALALRLHFLDGMPLKRIAAFLDVPVSTVKWRLYRGKHLMRDALQRLDPPPA
jgi:RNA polymerase sigma-70 factor (ECF subfamily)